MCQVIKRATVFYRGSVKVKVSQHLAARVTPKNSIYMPKVGPVYEGAAGWKYYNACCYCDGQPADEDIK